MRAENEIGEPSGIYFGGPEQAGILRNLLAEQIARVPAGGAINWVCYYFRDRRLAQALIQAHQRGVRVTVCMSARPRTADANEAVAAMLAGADGLGAGLRLISLPGIPAPHGRAWRIQVHEKLYCFSHPRPIVYIGSFNPSGDSPETRPDIIAEIGDQDRGYNVLAGLADPLLVRPLVEHAQQMCRRPPSLFYRFCANANQPLTDGVTTIHFWPRTGPHPLIQFLQKIGQGARVRIAASHIRANGAVKAMIALVKRGADLEILTDPGLRRVPVEIEQRLMAAGIRIGRVSRPDNVPMHFKFILVEHGSRVWSIFGSFNWTNPSFWLNHEIAAITSDPGVFSAFLQQWERLQEAGDKGPVTNAAGSVTLT